MKAYKVYSNNRASNPMFYVIEVESGMWLTNTHIDENRWVRHPMAIDRYIKRVEEQGYHVTETGELPTLSSYKFLWMLNDPFSWKKEDVILVELVGGGARVDTVCMPPV